MGRLVELRDYHFRRESWEEYRMWANDAMEILRDHFDVVGFWFDVGIQSEISGSNPMELPLGSANVTWDAAMGQHERPGSRLGRSLAERSVDGALGKPS